MNKKITSLLLATGLVLGVGASRSFAATVNVTVADNDPTTNYFGASGHQQGNEDNETEGGTVNTQQWDMEAFVVSGSTLYIVGGYDMQNGFGGYAPGDLFIKVGGSNPGFAPTAPGSGDVNNASYNYTYAIDLSQPVGATGSAAEAFSLSSSSVFNTVFYDQFGSNPWRYSSAGTSIGNHGMAYISGVADGSAAMVALGLGSYTGGLHNILAVDLSFLSVAAGTQVYFSYTMECGNDSLKGQYGGGFDRVPDSTTSILLISLGLGAVSLFGLKRRRA